MVVKANQVDPITHFGRQRIYYIWILVMGWDSSCPNPWRLGTTGQISSF